MLVFRILGTIFVGLSCITTMIKNANCFSQGHDKNIEKMLTWIATVWGWLWRAFVIVALWLI